jgi:[CysO sulfur-carrier protein]-S-L-cysteine hydrolase
VLTQLTEQVRRELQQECCGLLAGRDGTITRVLAAINSAEDKTKSYEIAPEELFRLMRKIRAAGLELMGIYHSHPNGNNEPSQRDIERAYYPDVAHFILSPRPNASRPVRAFAIGDGRATELEIRAL